MKRRAGLSRLVVVMCLLVAGASAGCTVAPRPSMAIRDLARHQAPYTTTVTAGLALQQLYDETAVSPELRVSRAISHDTTFGASFATVTRADMTGQTSEMFSSVEHPLTQYAGRVYMRYEPRNTDRFALLSGLGGGWVDNGASFGSADVGAVFTTTKWDFIEQHVGLLTGLSVMLDEGPTMVRDAPWSRERERFAPESSMAFGLSHGTALLIGERVRLGGEVLLLLEESLDGDQTGGWLVMDLSLGVSF